jgi:hypothetical protein
MGGRLTATESTSGIVFEDEHVSASAASMAASRPGASTDGSVRLMNRGVYRSRSILRYHGRMQQQREAAALERRDGGGGLAVPLSPSAASTSQQTLGPERLSSPAVTSSRGIASVSSSVSSTPTPAKQDDYALSATARAMDYVCENCTDRRRVAERNVYFRFPTLKYKDCPFSAAPFRQALAEEAAQRAVAERLRKQGDF